MTVERSWGEPVTHAVTTSLSPAQSRARSLPSAGRPTLSAGAQVLGVVLGLWMVIGLFLDGWAHDTNRPESFFTPWHGILYGGFAAASAAAVAVAVAGRTGDGPWRARLPVGHGLTLAALAVFGAAAAGDLLWHETFGVEVGLEALLSPTHLMLMTTGIIVLSAPARSAWAASPTAVSLRQMAPVAVSLALVMAVAGFFTLYVSPFVNDAAAIRFDRAADVPHDHPSTDVAELQQLLGVASILMTTVLVAVPILLVQRRWRPPVGTYTLLVGAGVALLVALDQLSEPSMMLIGLPAGAVADLVTAARWSPAAAPAATAVLWGGYFGLHQVTWGPVAWSAELWSGAVVSAILLTVPLSLLPGHAVGGPAATETDPS